jgi:hypothetical protein
MNLMRKEDPENKNLITILLAQVMECGYAPCLNTPNYLAHPQIFSAPSRLLEGALEIWRVC